MNILKNKALSGSLALMISASLNMLRVCGVNVPEAVDPAVNQLLVAASGLYLIYHGWNDALNTPAPPAVDGGAK